MTERTIGPVDTPHDGPDDFEMPTAAAWLCIILEPAQAPEDPGEGHGQEKR